MDLSFIDINNAFSNFVQQDSLAKGQLAFENSQDSYQSFADKLNEMLKGFKTIQGSNTIDNDASAIKGNIDTAKSLFDNDVSAIKGNISTIEMSFTDAVGQHQSLQFLSNLKDFFLQLSNGNLSNINMDVQGLDVLEKMLLKAGFDSGEVDELISGLSEKIQYKGSVFGDLSLKEVMDSLFKLSTETEEESEEVILETSALPFITSVLTSLGFPQEEVSQIMSQADRGQKGISLDVVIDQLKSIESQSLYTGQSFKTQEGDASFTGLFEQLGLAVPENNSSQLSLNGFIYSLETLKQNFVEAENNTSESSTIDLINNTNSLNTDIMVKESFGNLFESLFKYLDIQSEKTSMPEFSYEQIKDQFKNDLLIPDKNNPNKKGLFSQNTISSDGKSEQILKEIESILSGKSGPATDSKSISKGGDENVKLLNPDIAKGGETFQLAASDIKPESTSLNALKTKASFNNLPNYVMNQVGKSVVRAINQGENTLSLQLKPPELGRLLMTIDHAGNSMKVSIITENHAAKDILTSNMNELKTVLANAGISLEKFDVDMDSNFRQSMADAKNQSSQFGKKKQNKGNNQLDAVTVEGKNDSAGGMIAAIQNGSYHFVA